MCVCVCVCVLSKVPTLQSEKNMQLFAFFQTQI